MSFKEGQTVIVTGNKNYHLFAIGSTVQLISKGGIYGWSCSGDYNGKWYVLESDMKPLNTVPGVDCVF